MKQRPRLRSQMASNYLKAREEDESGEETELFTRNTQPFRDIPTVEKVIEEGDTLQALSIKYRCSIAELKRLNNIHKENEIYAKRSIKVPAHAISLALVHTSGSSSPKEKPEVNHEESLKNKLSDTLLSLPSTSTDQTLNGSVNSVIFNSSIKPIEKDCDKTIIDEYVDEEEICLLPNNNQEETELVVSRLSCNGADADISWIALVICVVLIIFAVPLIYVFYIAEHPEEYSHHNS